MSTVIRPQPVARPPSRPAPELRVVEPAGGRLATGRLALGLALCVMFGALMLSAVFHSALVSGQRRLDRLEREVGQREQRVSRMRLQVAVLSSPQRVVAEAKAQGMVEPDHINWLVPGQPPAPSSPAAKASQTPSPSSVPELANRPGSAHPAPTR